MKVYQLHSFIIIILVMIESVENIIMKMNTMVTIMSNEKAIFYYPYMAYHIPLSTNEKLIKYKCQYSLNRLTVSCKLIF